YVGLNFTAQTYPGLPEAEAQQREPLDVSPPSLVGFTFHVLAAATPLTPDEFVAQQRRIAEDLRQQVLADPTATQALRVVAADAPPWPDLYLTALQQAGLLRPVDVPPEVHQDPELASLMATLAAGILAGPAGDQVLSGNDLPAFFARIHQWY